MRVEWVRRVLLLDELHHEAAHGDRALALQECVEAADDGRKITLAHSRRELVLREGVERRGRRGDAAQRGRGGGYAGDLRRDLVGNELLLTRDGMRHAQE